MKKIVVSLWLLSELGCQPFSHTIQIFKRGDFILVDTTYEQVAKQVVYDGYGNYPIYYKGPSLDTIRIGTQCNWHQSNITFPPNTSMGFTPSSLKMFVDTSIKTTLATVYLSKDGKKVDSFVNYNAYLIMIQNTTDSVIYLGRTSFLYYLYREIKKPNGEWVKIERKLSSYIFCSSGQPYIFLQPGEIILSKAGKYKGNLLVDCRLVMHNRGSITYSNVFKDYIDIQQLQIE